MFRLKLITVLFAIYGMMAYTALASQTVKLGVAFSSERPAASGVTINTHLDILTPAGQVPSPVTNIKLVLPPGIQLGSSELGLETCNPTALQDLGREACPPNSVMGFGTALSEVPFGPIIVQEPVAIRIYAIEPVGGHTAMVFYVDGETPVSAQIVFPAVLLPGGGAPGSAYLNTVVPLTPSLPGAPYASTVNIHVSFGPEHLTYYRYARGHRVAFRPTGIVIPPHCPKDGFRFTAIFTFQDGTTASSSANTPCPRRR